MYFIRKFVLLLLFCGANCIQVPPNDVRKTILGRFKGHVDIKSCKTPWTDPEIVDFLKSCDVVQPAPTNFTRDTSDAFLCMVYFDLNVRLCSELRKDASYRSLVPVNKTEVQNIFDHFDSTDIAKDFCNSSHADIFNISSGLEYAKQYMDVFVKTISNSLQCELLCFELNSKLKPFCKSILWITQILNSHIDKFNGMHVLNQSKKDNNIGQLSKNLESTVGNQIALGSVPAGKPTSTASINVVKDQKEVSSGSSSAVDVLQPAKTLADSTNKKELSSKVLPATGQEAHFVPSPNVLIPPHLTAVPEKPPQDNMSSKVSSTTTSSQKSSSASIPEPAVNVPQTLDSSNLDDALGDVEPDIGNTDPDDKDIEDYSAQQNKEKQQEPVQNVEEMESAAGMAGGASPVEVPINEGRNDGVRVTGHFVDSEDSHFFPYFLFISGVLIVGYIVYHNKNKVLGLLLEGRKSETRRRCPSGGPAYRKLDCTLEEAVNSAPPSHTPHIVY